MEGHWNDPVRSFVQSNRSRWGISSHPDIFSPDEEIHKERLKEIKDLIDDIQGVYNTTQLANNLRVAKLKKVMLAIAAAIVLALVAKSNNNETNEEDRKKKE